MNPHPSQRFLAPSAIQHGVPLKEVLDRKLVILIGESLAGVVSGFNGRRFRANQPFVMNTSRFGNASKVAAGLPKFTANTSAGWPAIHCDTSTVS